MTAASAEGILALDIGTSSVRATLVGLTGEVLARHEAATPIIHEPGARATLDADTLWPLLCGVIRGAIEDHTVLAVGLTAQLGVVLVDAEVRALTPILLWADARASAYASRVEDALASLPQVQVGRRITGESTAARLLWFADHDPGVLHRAHKVLSLKDWMVSRLTETFATDPVHASYSALVDIPSASWSDAAFTAIGMDPSLAPQVLEAHALAGGVSQRGASETGLPEGIPVAIGGPDGTVGSLGAGAVAPGITVDIAGSTDVLVQVLERDVLDEAGIVTTNAHLAGGMWTIGGATGITGGAIDWLARLHGAGSTAEFLGAFGAPSAALPPGGDGVLVDTALGGHRFPYWDSGRGGTILGALQSTGPADLLLAAREGAAFLVREALRELTRLGAKPERLTTVGGLARDPAALQLRADVCGVQVLGIGDGLATTRGAAALAGCAAGLYSSLPAAVEAIGVSGREFAPRPDIASRYDEVHARWTQAFRPLFDH